MIVLTPVEFVFSVFATAFGAVFTWFFQFLSATGATGIYLLVFVMYTVVRFLIVPIVGSRDSDDVGDN